MNTNAKAPRTTTGSQESYTPSIEQAFDYEQTRERYIPQPRFMPEVVQTLESIDLEAFTKDLISDAIASALPRQWEKRAQVFEWARPRPDDFNGQASEFEIAKRDKDLAATAAACRLHAAMLRGDDLLSPRFSSDIQTYLGITPFPEPRSRRVA